MKFKKVIAAALSLFMLGGVVTYNAPAVRDFVIVADAAGECYTFNSTTGLLTLKGDVILEEITGFEQRDAVKKIKVAGGVRFPEDCSGLFAGYANCISIDISQTVSSSDVKNMSGMFIGCSALTSLDLSSFDTSSVTDMGMMFNGCNALTSLDLSGFDTSSVTGMRGMFSICSSLTSLDMICYTDRAVDKHPKIWYNRNNQTRRGKSNEVQQRIQRRSVKAFR